MIKYIAIGLIVTFIGYGIYSESEAGKLIDSMYETCLADHPQKYCACKKTHVDNNVNGVAYLNDRYAKGKRIVEDSSVACISSAY